MYVCMLNGVVATLLVSWVGMEVIPAGGAVVPRAGAGAGACVAGGGGHGGRMRAHVHVPHRERHAGHAVRGAGQRLTRLPEI